MGRALGRTGLGSDIDAAGECFWIRGMKLKLCSSSGEEGTGKGKDQILSLHSVVFSFVSCDFLFVTWDWFL